MSKNIGLGYLFVVGSLMLHLTASAQPSPFGVCDAKKYDCASPKQKINYRGNGCYNGSGCGPSGNYTSLGAAENQAEIDFFNFHKPNICSISPNWTPDAPGAMFWGSITNTFSAKGTYNAPKYSDGNCTLQSTYDIAMVTVYQEISYQCEPGWEKVGFENGSTAGTAYCRKPKYVCAGTYNNPCNLITGEKVHNESDVSVGSTGLLKVERRYSSIPSAKMYTVNALAEDRWRIIRAPSLEHYSEAYPGSSVVSYWKRVINANTASTFQLNNGAWMPYSVSDGLLAQGPDELGYNTWFYYPSSGNKIFWFRNGLVSEWLSSGVWVDHSEALSKDVFGRKIDFFPNQVALPDSTRINYSSTYTVSTNTGFIAFNKLDSVTYQDGSQRSYFYENANLPGNVTGVVDEIGQRIATWTYDTQSGKLIQTYTHAPGVRQYTYSYTGSGVATSAVTVWTPSQAVSTVNLVDTPVGPKIGSRADDNCDEQCRTKGAIKSTVYASDFVESEDDFNGNRVCYSYNDNRGYETTRVEGLAKTQVCSTVTTVGAVLPLGARKISTQWHPHWRLETKVAQPNRVTTSVYNGQPDPFNGNAIASCAPATALLPDGKPIAVLCKQVEQATTDATGAASFSAVIDTTVANRVWQWTYNQYGQMLTAKDPLSNTTAYAYYTDTTADHAIGDLWKVTNAMGHVTTYTKYNPLGNLLESVDPNGLVTTRTYDLRQRTKSILVGGLTTSFDYYANGTLKQVTSPDNSWVGYEYDGSQRLTAVKDNIGNRIEYVLDNAGNRTNENAKDPSGKLKRQISRISDVLNRLQQSTGGL